MDKEQLDRLWSDTANWKWGLIYRCPTDPRTIVPRRWRWGGWTLNFGHPQAGLVGLMALALAAGPGLLTLLLVGDHSVFLIVLFLSVVALAILAHLESTRRR